MPGGYVNKVQLVGNLGRDPEIRQFNSGGAAANLSLATSTKWTDRQSGERREETEWHRIVVYTESTVRFIEKYLRKGAKIYVEGQLKSRSWTDQQGQKRYTTEVVVRPFKGTIEALDRPIAGDPGENRTGERAAAARTAAPIAEPKQSLGTENAGSWSRGGGNFDQDIPF